METKTKDLWVFIETTETGAAENVSLELLRPGRELAQKQGGRLVAVIIGSHITQAADSANIYGADLIITIDSKEYKNYSTDAYSAAMIYLLEKYSPTTMLIGATYAGRDLAPRLAGRLKTGLTADCISLDLDESSGSIAWTRPAFGGNLMAVILCPDHRPQLGTVRPGVFRKPEQTEGNAEIIAEDFSISAKNIRTEVLETIRNAVDEIVDLEGAEIIVSGGRGVGSPEGFTLLRELAEVLGATIGASRAATDAGWISPAHQIGQTGKMVSPKLYFACGISGAIQHRAGIRDCDCLVAINKDPDAPIFDFSNYGIVGSISEVLPVMIAELKKMKE